MKNAIFSPRIKQPKGWIAAGDGFRMASRLLSDGAFKLFVHLALEADSRTGCVRAAYKDLAVDLKKSKRAIGTYAEELSEKEICKVRPGENQYCKTDFEIYDIYWPYEREAHSETIEPNSYVATIQKTYLSPGCTKARFSAGDTRKAWEFERQGVPLDVVEDAMLMGACRKYASWLEGGDSEPIGSLAYFENLATEIQRKRLPQGYTEHLRVRARKLAEAWAKRIAPDHSPEQKYDKPSASMAENVLAHNSNQQNGENETG
jgi:hypothetical protein